MLPDDYEGWCNYLNNRVNKLAAVRLRLNSVRGASPFSSFPSFKPFPPTPGTRTLSQSETPLESLKDNPQAVSNVASGEERAAASFLPHSCAGKSP
jgi:hypothetical protein